MKVRSNENPITAVAGTHIDLRKRKYRDGDDVMVVVDAGE
jgi:hypothetical protein